MAASGLVEIINELGILQHGLLDAITKDTASRELRLSQAPPSLQRDVVVCAIFALIMLIFNWTLRLLIIQPLIRSTFRGIKAAAVEKFGQSLMEIIFYGGSTLLGLLVVPQQVWAWPSSLWWQGWMEGGHESMRSDLRCYYILYAARYIQSGISTCLEHKRKDFIEMQIHHWTTVLLIAVSYAYGWNRIGAIIMLILDPADVPLHMAKVCKYVSDHAGIKLFQSLADAMFVLFALSFIFTRLMCYPYVVWSAHIEASRYFPKRAPEYTCVVLLYILLILQIYWFSLLAKVVWKVLVGDGAEDVRSDDEDEVNEDTRKKKKN